MLVKCHWDVFVAGSWTQTPSAPPSPLSGCVPRPLQSLVRIPETLVVAMEFITLPTPAEQMPALEELRKATCRWACLQLRCAGILRAACILLGAGVGGGEEWGSCWSCCCCLPHLTS